MSRRLSSAELHFCGWQNSGLWDGKIRVIGTRILREGWDADFGAGECFRTNYGIIKSSDQGQAPATKKRLPSPKSPADAGLSTFVRSRLTSHGSEAAAAGQPTHTDPFLAHSLCGHCCLRSTPPFFRKSGLPLAL